MPKTSLLISILVLTGIAVLSSAADMKIKAAQVVALPLPGEQWLGIDDAKRHAYVVGYIGGNNSLVSTLGGGILKKKPGAIANDWIELHKKYTITENPYEIANQVTYLYQDPANIRISIDSIVGLAIDKIKGRDIAKDLIFLRKLARGELPDAQTGK
jgi:hypothetical protein